MNRTVARAAPGAPDQSAQKIPRPEGGALGGGLGRLPGGAGPQQPGGGLEVLLADQGLVEAVVILPAEVDLAGVDGVFQHAQHLGGGPAAGVAGGQLPADGVDGFPRQEQGEGLPHLDGLVRVHL